MAVFPPLRLARLPGLADREHSRYGFLGGRRRSTFHRPPRRYKHYFVTIMVVIMVDVKLTALTKLKLVLEILFHSTLLLLLREIISF